MPGRLSPAALPHRLSAAAARSSLLALLAAAGCNSALPHGFAPAFEDAPSARACVYEPAGDAGPDGAAELLARFAPAFAIEGEADWDLFTALRPWKREASRLDRSGRALAELGFDVAVFAPERDG